MATELNDWRDILALLAYFVVVLVVGIVSSRGKERGTAEGYFLAGRNLAWLPIGFSLWASSIGTEHFIGLAASGARSGIAAIAAQWGAVLPLLLLGWVFLPVYLTANVVTVPEYLERRFSGTRLRVYFSVLSVLMYVATKISVELYAASIIIDYVVGWNTYYCITVLLSVTVIYTVIGGLAAVIYTDVVQTVVMLGGSIYIATLAFVKIGSLWALYYKYRNAVPSNNDGVLNDTTCGLDRDDAFHVIRDPSNSDLPWPGLIINSTLASLWHWCADQVVVQRTLASRNISHARGAVVTAGYLKLLALFLIVFPGMISRVLYQDEVACLDELTCTRVCGNPAGCSHIAYPRLILGLAPAGARGLMIAVMMSALVSSLTSVFNSASALFTMDMWTRIRKEPSEKELVICGRISVLVVVAISVAWIPVIKAVQGPQLFMYIQTTASYVTAPVAVIFLLAVFVPRINETGAFWGLVIGQACGVVRLVVEIVFPAPGCGEVDNRHVVLSKVNVIYFPVILMVISTSVVVVISLCTERPAGDLTLGSTFWSVRSLGRKRLEGGKRTSRPLKVNVALVERGEYIDEDLRRFGDSALSGFDRKQRYKNGYTANCESKNRRMDRHSDGDVVHKDRKSILKQQMIISTPSNWIVNINAVGLMCVFILMYALFA